MLYIFINSEYEKYINIISKKDTTNKKSALSEKNIMGK